MHRIAFWGILDNMIMLWKQPPVIKIYEALGAVADDRVELIHTAEVRPRQIDKKITKFLWHKSM